MPIKIFVIVGFCESVEKTLGKAHISLLPLKFRVTWMQEKLRDPTFAPAPFPWCFLIAHRPSIVTNDVICLFLWYRNEMQSTIIAHAVELLSGLL